ncbi:MAG: energy transducer TonB [Rhodospirillales bacterium]|nr:TonB family protein [Rhodospirillales bacterium]MDE1884069.1 energy transducer TonB [Rhodospirillales bacterium]MDE2458192.1 energy transducer TonB [Rhodospirillales bacterium]
MSWPSPDPPARLSLVDLARAPSMAGPALHASAVDRLEAETPLPAGWPWRLAGLAGLAHIALAVLLVLAGRLHLPAPPPAPVSIQLVSETIPQGASATRAAAPPLPVPPPPMPSQVAEQLPEPPPAMPPSQTISAAHPAAQVVSGARIKAVKTARVTVAVTHPAVPFADNQAPDYPQADIDAGEQGVVRFVLQLGADGRVQGFRLTQSSGYADLDANVRAAAMGWRYQPAMRNGVAVPSVVQFFVKFTPH